MIPYGRQSINSDDIKSVAETLRSDWLTQGPKVLEFEKKLAEYSGVKFAVAVSSGTSALHLAYLASGLKKGDEVITTPNTFVATSNMLLHIGAKPVFCDIRLDTYNIDESKIEKLITKKTKAIVPVHFAGQPCEMGAILKIAKKYKLLVIEDGCHALGAEYRGRKIGGFGDLTVFSFHPVKPITTGEGGAVLTNSENFYKELLLLRSHGIAKDKKGFNVMTELGFNYRITDIQAALGISQLKRLEIFAEKRLRTVRLYEKYFSQNDNIILPKEITGSRSAWHLFVIRTKRPADRLPLYNFLKSAGVGVNFHYPAVYSHPYYKKIGYKKVKLISMDGYHNSAITLPCYANLALEDIKFIVATINNYYRINYPTL